MNLTKTQREIISEIEAKGYAVIQHGHNSSSALGRVGSWGARKHNAMIQLRERSVITVTATGCDRDSHRGRSCISGWARVEFARTVAI